MKITLTRTRLAVAVALAAAVAAGAGWAAIPGTRGVISACVNSKGALKIIDADAGQGCGSQQLLQWSAVGAPGGAPTTAYARVLPPEAGNVPLRVDAARANGITAANVVHPGTGTYCFGGLPFTPKSITVTPGLSSGLDEPTSPVTVRADLTGVDTCPEGFKQGRVAITDLLRNPRDADIYIVLGA